MKMSTFAIKGISDFSDLLESKLDFSNDNRFFKHLLGQLKKSPEHFWMHIIVLKEHESDELQFCRTWSCDFSALPPNVLGHRISLPSLSDCDFWKLFHLQKNTYLNLIQHLYDLYDTTHLNPKDILRITVGLWYLRNDRSPLTEALELFNFPSVDVAEIELEKGLKLIAELTKKHIQWPNDEEEITRIQTDFMAHYLIPDVIGVIGHKVIKTEKDENIFVQIISNDRCVVNAINISYESNLKVAMKTSPLMSRVEAILQDRLLIANEEYKCFPGLHFAVPLNESDTSPYAAAYNLLTREALKFIDACFIEVLARFPKLRKLHKRLPEAFIAAFGLHNFCAQRGDIYPDLLLQAKETLGLN